jgi:NADPH:quinone reductase-like Zn-dependent oxidoreductase
MKAARVHQYGPPTAITLEELPIPVPGPKEVLVRVHAAGVGPWDAWVRAGKSVLPQPLPLTLGSDLSGVIAAVGSGVAEFAPGDEVFGVTNPRFTGAYAEYAIAAAGMIARKPASLSHVDAASVPVVAVTAWHSLFDEAHLERGASVLIHGAAGNVGAYAVQLARAAGLHVTATSFARDIAYVRSLGAHNVVDVGSQRFEDVAGKVDAVIDLVGGETQQRSFAVLKAGGHLVSAVSAPDQKRAMAQGVTARFFLVRVTTDSLNRIAALIDAGRLRTNVKTVLPLAAAREAHEMLDGVRPRPGGKIVLRLQ